MIATSDPIIVPAIILPVVGIVAVVGLFVLFMGTTYTDMDCGTIGCPVPPIWMIAATINILLMVAVAAIWLMPDEEKKQKPRPKPRPKPEWWPF